MKQKHIQILGVVLSAIFAIFIVFLYATEPRSIGELSEKASKTASDVLTKSQVVTGTYQVDAEKFAKGIELFRAEDFPGSRTFLLAADPEKRDGKVQFYIAYSFYRQGWGRFASDDELFGQGLEYARHADTLLDSGYISDDDDLKLKTPAALINVMEEGTKTTAYDFNPMRILRERK
ncbi:MAG: hypothetical protein ACRD6X_05610 [Pyrinomonadaceae bacterium]